MDLGHDSIASRLRDQEEARVAIRKRNRDAVRYGALAAVCGAAWGANTGGGLSFIVVAGVFAGLVSGLSLYYVARPDGGPPSSFPTRWALALPPTAPVTEVVQGPARPVDEVLFAPFTGRRCVAYEVGVRFERGRSPELNRWALLEQRVTPMTVDGRAVDVGVTHLELPRHHLGRSSKVPMSDAARDFLAQRGLDSHTLTFELFESIVEVDALAELRMTREGMSLKLQGGDDGPGESWPDVGSLAS